MKVSVILEIVKLRKLSLIVPLSIFLWDVLDVSIKKKRKKHLQCRGQCRDPTPWRCGDEEDFQKCDIDDGRWLSDAPFIDVITNDPAEGEAVGNAPIAACFIESAACSACPWTSSFLSSPNWYGPMVECFRRFIAVRVIITQASQSAHPQCIESHPLSFLCPHIIVIITKSNLVATIRC